MSAALVRRLIITGRVQGVGYRDWAAREARKLGLSGWVRNRGDGSVELLARGDGAALERLVERCRRGPIMARVTGVAVEEAQADVPDGFERREDDR